MNFMELLRLKMNLNNCVGRRHIKDEASHQVDLLVGYFKSRATQLTLDKNHKQNMLERAWEDHETPSVLGVHSFNKY